MKPRRYHLPPPKSATYLSGGSVELSAADDLINAGKPLPPAVELTPVSPPLVVIDLLPEHDLVAAREKSTVELGVWLAAMLGTKTHDELSDQELLRLARGGNGQLFYSLINRYQNDVYRWVRHHARSLQEADWFDITQAVWLKVWQRIMRADDLLTPSFGEYLHRAVESMTLDELRKFNRRRKHIVDSREDREGTGVPDSSASPARATEIAEIIESALAALDEKSVRIVRGRLGGQTLEQIAVEMGLPPSQVQKSLQKTFQHVRELLSARGLGADDLL